MMRMAGAAICPSRWSNLLEAASGECQRRTEVRSMLSERTHTSNLVFRKRGQGASDLPRQRSPFRDRSPGRQTADLIVAASADGRPALRAAGRPGRVETIRV